MAQTEKCLSVYGHLRSVRHHLQVVPSPFGTSVLEPDLQESEDNIKLAGIALKQLANTDLQYSLGKTCLLCQLFEIFGIRILVYRKVCLHRP